MRRFFSFSIARYFPSAWLASLAGLWAIGLSLVLVCNLPADDESESLLPQRLPPVPEQNAEEDADVPTRLPPPPSGQEPIREPLPAPPPSATQEKPELEQLPPVKPVPGSVHEPQSPPQFAPPSFAPSNLANESAKPGKKNLTLLHDYAPEHQGDPRLDCDALLAPFSNEDFCADPVYPAVTFSTASADAIYRQKKHVPVQRPWVELGRGFYLPGPIPPGNDLLGPTNLTAPHFLVYGDLRTVGAANTSQGARTDVWATKLQLETDLKLTATERFHALFTPLNRNANTTRLQVRDDGSIDFIEGFNAKPTTAFFEGDLGAMLGGWRGTDSPFDLPITAGLVPLFFQNGIWMNDAILGFACNFPATNSPRLGWSNYEVTLFAGFDNVTSDAFKGQDSAADLFGAAAFIEAYGGYIETGYAYLDDQANQQQSYHNFTAAFTRRYFGRVSNSIRGIVNVGQQGPGTLRTADGALLLWENSLITSLPSNFVPYANFFAGTGSPQSVARQGAAGGVLTNTGISFEIDNITNYPTLDATGHNSCGGALGFNLMDANFLNSVVLEAALVHPYGNANQRAAVNDQFALSARFQRALSKSLIFRTDAIYGFLADAPNIAGVRVELRHKF